jgi:hypothetical protein
VHSSTKSKPSAPEAAEEAELDVSETDEDALSTADELEDPAADELPEDPAADELELEAADELAEADELELEAADEPEDPAADELELEAADVLAEADEEALADAVDEDAAPEPPHAHRPRANDAASAQAANPFQAFIVPSPIHEAAGHVPSGQAL